MRAFIAQMHKREIIVVIAHDNVALEFGGSETSTYGSAARHDMRVGNEIAIFRHGKSRAV